PQKPRSAQSEERKTVGAPAISTSFPTCTANIGPPPQRRQIVQWHRPTSPWSGAVIPTAPHRQEPSISISPRWSRNVNDPGLQLNSKPPRGHGSAGPYSLCIGNATMPDGEVMALTVMDHANND